MPQVFLTPGGRAAGRDDTLRGPDNPVTQPSPGPMSSASRLSREVRMLGPIWVKIKPPEKKDRRFWSMLPFTWAPFTVPIFDPQPY